MYCVLCDHPSWVVVVMVVVVCLQEVYDIYIVINSHNFICILWYYFHSYQNIFLPQKAA
jgi:hypothetical protein